MNELEICTEQLRILNQRTKENGIVPGAVFSSYGETYKIEHVRTSLSSSSLGDGVYFYVSVECSKWLKSNKWGSRKFQRSIDLEKPPKFMSDPEEQDT